MASPLSKLPVTGSTYNMLRHALQQTLIYAGKREISIRPSDNAVVIEEMDNNGQATGYHLAASAERISHSRLRDVKDAEISDYGISWEDAFEAIEARIDKGEKNYDEVKSYMAEGRSRQQVALLWQLQEQHPNLTPDSPITVIRCADIRPINGREAQAIIESAKEAKATQFTAR